MATLYLVQHGEAKSKTDDPERPLTDQGERTVRRVAEFVGRCGLEVAEIRHSGKLRARQTAALLAEPLKPRDGVMAVEGLGPKDDVKPVARALGELDQSVMLVGHLPFLSRLVSRLVTGNTERTVVRFQMGGIVCLHYAEETGWAIAWMVTPDLLGS